MSDSVGIESPAVQSYLTILQGVIGRVASNSASAKTWCVTLVSAIVVVVAEKGGPPDLIWISLLPVALFFLLDAYYLGLERQFRERYNTFIKKLHEEKAKVDDVFIVTPGGDLADTLWEAFKACGSVSVWPFYILLALILLAVRTYVLIPAHQLWRFLI